MSNVLKSIKDKVLRTKEYIKENYLFWEALWKVIDFFEYLKHFFTQVVRVIQYIPVIWKDEDWDYKYVLDLLDFKLARMEKEFTKIGYDEAKQIKRVREYIRNYEDPDTYYPEVEPEPFAVDFKTVNNTFVTVKAETGEELTEKETEIRRKYLENLYSWQQEQWCKMWDLIKDRLSYWWD